MFDISKAIVIGNEFRHSLRDSAREWLKQTLPNPDQYRGIDWDMTDLIAFRNRVIRDIVLPTAYEWALFIDNDVTVSHPGVESFLAIDADLVSCQCRMRTPAAWNSPKSFHTTFWFARIEIFRKLPPPWFMFTYSTDGCEMLKCECQFFRDRVVAAGYTVKSGGWCGHGCEAKWCG